jgi:hypothetical protein
VLEIEPTKRLHRHCSVAVVQFNWYQNAPFANPIVSGVGEGESQHVAGAGRSHIKHSEGVSEISNPYAIIRIRGHGADFLSLSQFRFALDAYASSETYPTSPWRAPNFGFSVHERLP